MRRRFLFFSFFSLIFTTATSPVLFAQEPSKTSRPNVIFIVIDAARADHFSCYGYKKNTTTNIDAISRRGALFLNHFSNDVYTRGSLPKIFSSRYFSLPLFENDGWRWGIKSENPHIIFRTFDPEQAFLTEVLSSHNYRTAAFHNQGMFVKETHFVKPFDESFAVFVDLEKYPTDEKIISEATAWLRKNKEEKFFVYFHIMSPHVPYPPKEEDKEFLKDERPSAVEKVRRKLRERKEESAKTWSKKELRILKGLYDSNLKHSDKWIGILYDELKELGLDENTLLIISSDHGESLGEHGKLFHGRPPWEPVIHVPLVMVYPPLIPAGAKVRGMTESVDIMPTILDICGIELPGDKSMDGVSLLEFIRNPEAGKKAVFTDISIRTEEYKYIVDKDLLYHFTEDSGETKNLAKQNPSIKQRLSSTFDEEMEPYRRRYEDSKREDSPDYPFYYRMHDFKIIPGYALERCCDMRSDNIMLKEAHPKTSWLLNVDWRRFGLFCLPENGVPPPLILSADIPNGNYRVSALLESAHRISLVPEESGFRFRWNPQVREDNILSRFFAWLTFPFKPFSFPREIALVQRYGRHFYNSLDLGEIEVKNEKLSVQISFNPQDKGLYVIRHIRFFPAASNRADSAEDSDKEEFRRKTRELKTLGYL